MQAYFPEDYASTYPWNRPHMVACIREGLLSLTRPGYLEPDKPVTRAEAARMVYKLLEKKNTIYPA